MIRSGVATTLGEDLMYRSVLVGIDGSASSREALRRAATIAKLAGAELHIVSAYQDSAALTALVPAAVAGLGAAGGSLDSALKEAADELLADAARNAES